MEFICVFSVSGSLAYYVITKESERAYKATLKNSFGNRDDGPQTIRLEKAGNDWQGQPWNDEIISRLTHCIENGS